MRHDPGRHARTETACAACSVKFMARNTDLKRGLGRTCSRACRGKLYGRKKSVDSHTPGESRIPPDSIPNIPRESRALTPKQAVFADQVLVVGPVAAARVAYPSVKDDRTAGIIAAQNMAKPTIIRSMSQKAEAGGLSIELCLRGIARALRSDNPMVSLRAAWLGLRLHGALRCPSCGYSGYIGRL